MDSGKSNKNKVKIIWRSCLNALFNAYKVLKKGVILIGRGIEYVFTGQSDYKLYSNKGVVFDAVTDRFKAKLVAEEVKEIMKEHFGISLKRPVIMNLFTGDEFKLKGVCRENRGVKGQYHYEMLGKGGMAHMIYIREGLENREFRAILAHEMSHAFLREEHLMGCHRYLREGFARWIEYKILIYMGLDEEAEKIRNLKTYRYGKAVEKIFRLEKKVGAKKAMEILTRID